jgi:hypothetical protein
MTNLMKNEYRYNSNFRKFVDEYCNNNRCTVDEAFCSEEIKKCFGYIQNYKIWVLQ